MGRQEVIWQIYEHSMYEEIGQIKIMQNHTPTLNAVRGTVDWLCLWCYVMASTRNHLLIPSHVSGSVCYDKCVQGNGCLDVTATSKVHFSSLDAVPAT